MKRIGDDIFLTGAELRLTGLPVPEDYDFDAHDPSDLVPDVRIPATLDDTNLFLNKIFNTKMGYINQRDKLAEDPNATEQQVVEARRRCTALALVELGILDALQEGVAPRRRLPEQHSRLAS